MNTDILELSNFVDVPLLRAGTFTPRNADGQEFSYSDEDIDEFARQSNQARDYIKHSILSQEYPGNPHILLSGKPIPPIVNILHQDHLRNTMRNTMREVTAEFSTKVIDGVKWLVGTFKNIPHEWAAFIRDKFNLRSVEIMPKFTDPSSGEVLDHAIRSVGFLDPLTAPAVGDQPSKFAVEFAGTPENGIVTIYHYQQSQGEKPMSDVKNNIEKAPETAAPQATPDRSPVSVVEFEAMKKAQEQQAAMIQEMQAALKASKDENSTLKADNDALSQRVEAQEQINEKKDIAMFCKDLETARFQDKHGHSLGVSARFLEAFKPLVEHLENRSVIEFSAEKQQTPRQAVQEFGKEVLEMAAKGALLVPMDDPLHLQGADPIKGQPKTRYEAVKEFMAAHKDKYQDENKDYARALADFNAANPNFKEGE